MVVRLDKGGGGLWSQVTAGIVLKLDIHRPGVHSSQTNYQQMLNLVPKTCENENTSLKTFYQLRGTKVVLYVITTFRWHSFPSPDQYKNVMYSEGGF